MPPTAQRGRGRPRPACASGLRFLGATSRQKGRRSRRTSWSDARCAFAPAAAQRMRANVAFSTSAAGAFLVRSRAPAMSLASRSFLVGASTW